jgi:hypothetical protein
MRTAGRILAILTVVALLLPWAPPILCARAGAAAMPCCKTQAPCDFQVKTNGCCSLERGPVAPAGTAGIQANSLGSSLVRQPQLATVDHATLENAGVLTPLGGDRLWYPPAHDRSASLFLRNASILR